jgi:predicted ATPase
LEKVTDAGLVPMAIARAAGVPIIELNVLESIRQHFRDQHALLLLDNFEHVLDAAPIIAQILSASPRLKIMVTSRSALHVAGEHLFSVDVLSLDASTQLFVMRAGAARSDFCVNGNGPAISDICRQLDGLPLAIELAAARMRMFDPQQLLALMRSPFTVLTLRHRDTVSHRRALHEAMAESEQLLSPEEAAAFRRLGIFVGGCSLPAAEAILGRDATQPMMDTLQTLADHSLICIDPQGDAPRITMLHTIREYALSRLKASGEQAELARRHAEHFTDFAELCEGDSPEARLEKFNEESGNLRASLAFARETDNALMQMRLLASFGQWQGLQWQTEDIAWLIDLFAAPATHAPALRRIRARALSVAGFSVLFMLDEGWSHARAMLDESARLFESLGDIDAQASSLSKLGCILWNLADISGCLAAAQRALQLDDDRQRRFSSAMANGLIAGALRDRGDYAQAVQRFSLSAQQFEALGDSSMATFQLGDVFLTKARVGLANAPFEAAWAEGKAMPLEAAVAFAEAGLVA